MEFYVLDYPSSESKTKLVVCDPDIYGEITYRRYLPSDEGDTNIQVVSGHIFPKFKLLKDTLTSTNKQYVLKAPGHPAVLLQSVIGMIQYVVGIYSSELLLKNYIQRLPCVDGVYIVKALGTLKMFILSLIFLFYRLDIHSTIRIQFRF